MCQEKYFFLKQKIYELAMLHLSQRFMKFEIISLKLNQPLQPSKNSQSFPSFLITNYIPTYWYIPINVTYYYLTQHWHNSFLCQRQLINCNCHFFYILGYISFESVFPSFESVYGSALVAPNKEDMQLYRRNAALSRDSGPLPGTTLLSFFQE